MYAIGADEHIMALQRMTCNHSQPHSQLFGQDIDGKWNTSKSSAYPADLNQWIAELAVSHTRNNERGFPSLSATPLSMICVLKTMDIDKATVETTKAPQDVEFNSHTEPFADPIKTLEQVHELDRIHEEYARLYCPLHNMSVTTCNGITEIGPNPHSQHENPVRLGGGFIRGFIRGAHDRSNGSNGFGPCQHPRKVNTERD